MPPKKQSSKRWDPPGLGYSLKRGSSRNVVMVEHEVKNLDWEQWYLIRSDAHWDNPDSKWGLMKDHLDEAVKRKAGVIDAGDLFCAMQGKYDPRSSKSHLRPEHQRDDYLDGLVQTAADWHEPYAWHWVAQGRGNHEQSIKKRHETDLLERLSARLKDRTGAPFPVTGYTGWVRFLFRVHKTQRHSKTLWHMHGYGGGGPVTLDTIQRNRQMTYVDADIIVSGHTHHPWYIPGTRIVLSQSGGVYHRKMLAIKCGTYKEEYRDGAGGWHVETGKPPKPTGGAWWLRFFVRRREQPESGRLKKRENEIGMEIREAVS